MENIKKVLETFDENTIVFLIPSIINCTEFRSKFTPEERLKQTIEQMKSLKELKNEHIKIILLELNPSLDNSLDRTELFKLVDLIVNFDTELYAHTNKCIPENFVMNCIVNILYTYSI